MAVDPLNNLLVVAIGDSYKIFDRTASGNVKPRAAIGGPKSLVRGSSILMTYPPKGLIIATVRGGSRFSHGDFAGVWSIHDNGDVPPRWKVGEGVLRDIRDVTIDPANKTVIIADKALNAVMTFSTPEIFDEP
jgi:hypothetical protein